MTEEVNYRFAGNAKVDKSVIFNQLTEKIDEALIQLGCRYTITTRRR